MAQTCVRTGMSWYMWGGQRTTCKCLFSLPATGFLGSNPSARLGDRHIHVLSHFASPEESHFSSSVFRLMEVSTVPPHAPTPHNALPFHSPETADHNLWNHVVE